MKLNLAPSRVAALILLLAGFAVPGGFAVPPDLAVRETRFWVLSLLVFVLGAVSATVVDHRVGGPEGSNLRWFHVVTGVCAMAAAVVLRYRLESGTFAGWASGASSALVMW